MKVELNKYPNLFYSVNLTKEEVYPKENEKKFLPPPPTFPFSPLSPLKDVKKIGGEEEETKSFSIRVINQKIYIYIFF